MNNYNRNDLPSVQMHEELKLLSEVSDKQLEKYQNPHRMELGCFLIVTHGEARLSINLAEYNIRGKSIITILPRHILQIIRHSDDFRCEIIAFLPEFVQGIELVRNVVSHMTTIERYPVLQLSDEEDVFIHELYTILFRIQQRIQQEQRSVQGIVSNLLMSFFYGLCAMYDKHGIEFSARYLPRKEEIVNRFHALVFKYCHKERMVNFYADMLCITPKYLSSLVRDMTGRSAWQFINEAVILEIKARLKSSNDTILQISESMNFANPSFFSKYFRKNTGMTPMEYRKE